MKFELTDEELKKYQDWLKEHNKTCPIHYEGAIGGKITFSFTQTGIGCFAKVNCACGEELLLSNVDEF